ncbi:NAD-dependent dehydratase [Burkholderia mayonis]|uniref:NAD-dependent dehydratase n=1 Tax=Burkholderia mayonis TaxID=1385591 RepID=A0A1B4FM46_9BURK|nr:NAD-dependent epimerase/dehydratase family protein [Burkholderia mayonis]AOJ04736.1 NAD-dependent dehydratase [Burkholderia mayonis]KVE41273.1 NAD-dependent dehydratase [Burkholderia mayonis]
MRVLILGGDGYLGWPTAMSLAKSHHEICVIDNYLRRNIARETSSEPLFDNPNLPDRAAIFEAIHGKHIRVEIGNCDDYRTLERVVRDFGPDVIVHYAEQPSAPYSMKGFDEARRTLQNNLGVTFNVIWAMLEHAPDCHLIKLGTMGEYGTPDIDIEEGWLDVEHNGRRQRFLYPRQAGSLYHTTKVLDTDLLWFYVRTHGLRVTDLMQGPVYGIETEESIADSRLMPNFHYDDIFGTVVNRFLVQAVAGVPLTVYGKGGQTRGYLNIKDTLQCIKLAIGAPADRGELRILNQFTEQFTVNELAAHVRQAGARLGLQVRIEQIANPRKELEDHYYNAKHRGLFELGLKPHYLTEDVLVRMFEPVAKHKTSIDRRKILPRVGWTR